MVLVVVGLVIFSRENKQKKQLRDIPDSQHQKLSQNDQLESPADGNSSTVEEVVVDDSKTLWISPTDGKPIDFAYVPAGSQLVLCIRPAAIVSHREGEKILAALGPWGEQSAKLITEITGAQLEEIDSLLLSVRPEVEGKFSYSLKVELADPWTFKQLAIRLPAHKERQVESQKVLISDNRTCFIPEENEGRILIACPADATEEIIASGANPPPWSRDLARIVRRTDAQRMATVLMPAKFLQTSGSDLLQGTATKLKEVIQNTAGEDSTAIALSLHWDENFFIELQSTTILNRQPKAYLMRLAERLSQSPEELEMALNESSFPPYGREVLTRFHAMVRELGNYARFDSVDGVSVVRGYLPGAAGHNLLAAAELMLNCSAAEVAQGAQEGNQNLLVQNKIDTVSAMLKGPTTLSLPKETLQKALELLSEDLGIAIEIRGNDLQLEGITKNQSLAIDLREQPAEAILLAILRKANPDPGATGPADPQQKLVYVVREAANGQPGAIVVTTRRAAENSGEKLPDVFRSAQK